MKPNYREWLADQGLAANTVTAQLHRCNAVQRHHGDIDEHFKNDGIQSLLKSLTYSASDERANKPNPSSIPLGPTANIRENLASYRHAVNRYRKFLEAGESGIQSELEESENLDSNTEGTTNTFKWERDLQAALRSNISQLEDGLEIIDSGREVTVESGRVDILARDSNNTPVIIELKAGTALPKAVSQILGYMGSYMDEHEEDVRGILVASDFTTNTELAARPVPNLLLRRYRYKFEFE